jgi:hypothetical protein
MKQTFISIVEADIIGGFWAVCHEFPGANLQSGKSPYFSLKYADQSRTPRI